MTALWKPARCSAYIEYMADILTVGDLESELLWWTKLMKSGKIAFLKEYAARRKRRWRTVAKHRKMPDRNLTMWFDGQNINEALFCEEFLQERRFIFANGAFFTPDGRVTDDLPLRGRFTTAEILCREQHSPEDHQHS